MLPMLGACVVLRIDPIASLDPQKAREAVDAWRALPTEPYVCFIVERGGFYQPWDPYSSYTVEFLLQGRPTSYPEKFAEAAMTVPILPTTIQDHPSCGIL